jgi:hypothetical protein
MLSIIPKNKVEYEKVIELVTSVLIIASVIGVISILILGDKSIYPSRMINGLNRQAVIFQRVNEAGYGYVILFFLILFVQKNQVKLGGWIAYLCLVLSDSRGAMLLFIALLFSNIFFENNRTDYLRKLSIILCSVCLLIFNVNIKGGETNPVNSETVIIKGGETNPVNSETVIVTKFNTSSERDVANGRIELILIGLQYLKKNGSVKELLVGVPDFDRKIKELGIDWQSSLHSYFANFAFKHGVLLFCAYMCINILIMKKVYKINKQLFSALICINVYQIFEPEYNLFNMQYIPAIALLIINSLGIVGSDASKKS